MVLTFEHEANIGVVFSNHAIIPAVSGAIFIIETDSAGVRFSRKWDPETGDADWSSPTFSQRIRVKTARAVKEYRKIGSLGKYGVLY